MNAQHFAVSSVGSVLEGAYRLTRLIGEGGMGRVYEAVQLRLNKRVAVKLMARELAANEEALARFRREAEITSHLGHPHLVTVIDFGMAESGQPYLVMEYLSGEDLDRRIRREGRLSVETAAQITRQAASALAAAHAQQIVHRDLKPANIFLVQAQDEPDFVKVLDFGISKVKAASAQLTHGRAIIGTPNYMAPEQATGMMSEIDHRSDQWALACIAWEMLSGRPAFWAEDVGALFYQILYLNPYPLTKLVAGLAPEVETVLLQALAKDPNRRFTSVRQFARRFESAALGIPFDITPMHFVLSHNRSAKPPIPDAALEEVTVPMAQPIVEPPTEKSPPEVLVTLGTATTEPAPILRRRLAAFYVIASGLGIVLMLAGVLALRCSSRSSDVTGATDVVQRMPTVIDLPVTPAPPAPSESPSRAAAEPPPAPTKAKRRDGSHKPAPRARSEDDPFELRGVPVRRPRQGPRM